MSSSMYVDTPAWQRAALDAATARDGVTDLTPPRRSVRFRLDGEDFEGAPEVPALVAFTLAERLERLTDADATAAERGELVLALVDGLLLPESAERFKARLGHHERPIGAATVMNVIAWLTRQYAEEPSTPTASEPTGEEAVS